MSHVSAALRAALAAAVLIAVSSCGGTPITPPPPAAITISCPTAMDANSADGSAVVVTYNAPVVTGVAPFTTSCAPASGTAFPVGTSAVQCTTTDSLARSATCSFSVRVIGPPRLTHTRFLSFGDSITEGLVSNPVAPDVLLASPTTAYPVTLETRLRARYRFQAPLPVVINRGIGGEFAASPGVASIGGLARLPSVLNTDRPEVLLLMEGTNDLLFLQAGADDAINALRGMVQIAKAQGVRVCLATIAPQRLSQRRPLVPLIVPAFNDRVRALAASENVVLVDVYNALKDNIQLYIGADDLHPTVAGYEKIADTFYEAITKNFEVQQTAGVAFR